MALGVFAEIYFARRARSKSEILKDRSDNKVAEANVRAAEARKEAEEAKLQYEKLKLIVSWRHIAADKAYSVDSGDGHSRRGGPISLR